MILNILFLLIVLSIFNVILLIFSCNKDVKNSDVNEVMFTNTLKEKPSFTPKNIKPKQVANLPKESQLAATGS